MLSQDSGSPSLPALGSALTYDVERETPREDLLLWNGDLADVVPRVRLPRVVDKDGQVGVGHGLGEPHPSNELGTAMTRYAPCVGNHLCPKSNTMLNIHRQKQTKPSN